MVGPYYCIIKQTYIYTIVNHAELGICLYDDMYIETKNISPKNIYKPLLPLSLTYTCLGMSCRQTAVGGGRRAEKKNVAEFLAKSIRTT